MYAFCWKGVTILHKNVCITHIKAISSFGDSIEKIYKNCFNRKGSLHQTINFIEDFDFYNHRNKIKTRIDKSGQICVHMLSNLVLNRTAVEKSEMGIITASKFGCPKSKQEYWEQLNKLQKQEFASPKVFVQSICNIPNSLATIECGVRGYANHFMGSSEAAMQALWQSTYCLENNISKEIANIAFDTIEEKSMAHYIDKAVTHAPICEAGSGMMVEKSDNNKGIFQILGFGFASNDKVEYALETALYKVVKDSGIKSEQIKFIISDSGSIDEFKNSEEKALINTFENPVPTVILKAYIGECFSAFPYLALGLIQQSQNSILPINKNSTGRSEFLNYRNVLINKGDIFLLLAIGNGGDVGISCLKVS